MALQLTAEDARQSLTAHVAAKGAEIFLKYGPGLGAGGLPALLADRACVRYPCQVAFDAAALQPGEFAHAEPLGGRPEDGFVIQVHPLYRGRPDDVAWLVLYHLVTVNYGGFASADDAETFGAAALGILRDEYYERLCALADELPAGPESCPPRGLMQVKACAGAAC